MTANTNPKEYEDSQRVRTACWKKRHLIRALGRFAEGLAAILSAS